MYEQSTRMAMQDARLIAVSCDNVTTINCQSWVKMHVFVVEEWKWILILLSLEQVVNDAFANNLTKLIVDALLQCSRFSKLNMGLKLMCFSTNGVTIFQGF